MTTEATTLYGGAEILSATEGVTSGSHTFSPLLGDTLAPLGPTSYTWGTDVSWGQDVIITGEIAATLYFDTSVDVFSTTTVTMSKEFNGTTTEIGSASSAGLAELAAHSETFIFATNGIVLEANSFLIMTVSVGPLEQGVLVTLLYGDAATPAGVTLSLKALDSDGDGFGDTIERQAGTDPNDALDYPGAPPADDRDNDGLKDIWENDNFGNTNATAVGDPDGDGCDNLCEQAAGTDPNNPDSDGDGATDGDELDNGTNPLVADSNESVGDAEEGSPEAWRATALFASSLGLAAIALLGRFT